jgi:membrane protein implicated in regulation of membrane protease activity
VKWWGWLLIALAILSVLLLTLAASYMFHRRRQRKLQRLAAEATPPLTKKVLPMLAS